jgi:hypothetical protein
VGLRLLAITSPDGHPLDSLPADIRKVQLGDIVALAVDSPYVATPPRPEDLQGHGKVIEAVFARRSVLPVPPGVVFRSVETLERWLELHSVVMTDTLAFLEDRVGARVHIHGDRDAGNAGRGADIGPELASAAAECMRRLRRQAVISVSLEREHSTSVVLGAAFLVERELWKEFVAAVEKESEGTPGLSVGMTGPWPPYDFVKMDFGG